jgi:hypothetical protein
MDARVAVFWREGEWKCVGAETTGLAEESARNLLL